MIGTLPVAYTSSDYRFQITARDKTTRELVDISGWTEITIQLRDQASKATVATASLASGITRPSTGVLSITIPAATMSKLRAGVYDVGGRFKQASGAIGQLIESVVIVKDGHVT